MGTLPHTRYEKALITRQQLYDNAIASGEATPFIYPWDTLPVALFLAGIVVKRHLPRQYQALVSWTLFGLATLHGTYVVSNRRTLGFGSGYGIGLGYAWGSIMMLVFVIMSDCSKDFVRLEWRDVDVGTKEQLRSNPNGSTTARPRDQLVQRRTVAQGSQGSGAEAEGDRAPMSGHLVWQTMPTAVYHCLDWTIDLMTSFRGPNWNYRLPTLPAIAVPPLPTGRIQITRSILTDPSTIRNQPGSGLAPKQLHQQSIVRTVIFYLLTDLARTVLITDLYFVGLVPMDGPSTWSFVPLLSRTTGISVNTAAYYTRLSWSLCALLTTLSFVFSLGPFTFYVIMPLIVNSKKLTYCPLQEAAMYPDYFGPVSSIADKGLAGFWGTFWHQMFRFGISEPSKPIVRFLKLKDRSQAARAIQLLVAFSLTGYLHAAASYATFSITPSEPWKPFVFFFLQAIAITLQTWTAEMITKSLKYNPPLVLRQIGNSVFVLVWLIISGPLLADDFALNGIWFFEPVPVSLFRGIRDGRWWTLGGRWAGMYRGVPGREAFWDRGLAYF